MWSFDQMEKLKELINRGDKQAVAQQLFSHVGDSGTVPSAPGMSIPSRQYQNPSMVGGLAPTRFDPRLKRRSGSLMGLYAPLYL